MADTATPASAAASPANASTDAPPFQLGKPRFQQVRRGSGLCLEGRRVAEERGSKLLSPKKSPLGLRVPDPPATGELSAPVLGTWATAALFLLVSEVGVAASSASYWPRRLSLRA